MDLTKVLLKSFLNDHLTNSVNKNNSCAGPLYSGSARRVSCDSAKAVVVDGDQQNIRRARDETTRPTQCRPTCSRPHGGQEDQGGGRGHRGRRGHGTGRRKRDREKIKADGGRGK